MGRRNNRYISSWLKPKARALTKYDAILNGFYWRLYRYCQKELKRAGFPARISGGFHDEGFIFDFMDLFRFVIRKLCDESLLYGVEKYLGIKIGSYKGKLKRTIYFIKEESEKTLTSNFFAFLKEKFQHGERKMKLEHIIKDEAIKFRNFFKWNIDFTPFFMGYTTQDRDSLISLENKILNIFGFKPADSIHPKLNNLEEINMRISSLNKQNQALSLKFRNLRSKRSIELEEEIDKYNDFKEHNDILIKELKTKKLIIELANSKKIEEKISNIRE